MELKDIKIKDFPSGEFKDNETLQVYIDRLNEANVNVVTGKLDEMVNWGGGATRSGLLFCHKLLRH